MPCIQRQLDHHPLGQRQSPTITVIGVGAIGRQVALQLAALGASQIKMIVFDRVVPTIITNQIYPQRDLGQLEDDATSIHIPAIAPSITVTPITDCGQSNTPLTKPSSAASSQSLVRTAIWICFRIHCESWQGDIIQVLITHNSNTRKTPSRVFPKSESGTGPGTASRKIYASGIVSGPTVHHFSRWIHDIFHNPNPNPNPNLSSAGIQTEEAFV